MVISSDSNCQLEKFIRELIIYDKTAETNVVSMNGMSVEISPERQKWLDDILNRAEVNGEV